MGVEVVVPLDKNINKIDNMWHFNATPALFQHVPRQPSLRLIYMLCFMHARRTVRNFALPQTESLWKSLHFFFLCLFLSFCSLFLLLSFLPLIIFLSWFPYLWLYFPYVSITLLPSSLFLCCFPYLPTNIAVKWLSFLLHVSIEF